jgi:membrane dipeptidase
MAKLEEPQRGAQSHTPLVDRRTFLTAAAAAGIAAVAGTTLRTEPAAAASAAGPRLVVDGLDTSDVTEEFLSLLRRFRVHCVHKTTEGGYDFGSLLRFVDAHPNEVVLARTVQNIRAAQHQGRIAIVCGSQSAVDYHQLLAETGQLALQYGTITDLLRTDYELGLRFKGIAYNTANMFGAGCLEPHSGLTRAGRRLVEEIHKLNVILDVGGHTGEQTSRAASRLYVRTPMWRQSTTIRGLRPIVYSRRSREAMA